MRMKRALIYDGECQFCVNCVDLLKRVGGDSIAYYPSSEFSKEHPEIPLANFEKAVQLIRENGTGASAAEAILETLTAFHPASKWIHSLYSKSLIVRSILDAGYEFVATHRQLFYPSQADL